MDFVEQVKSSVDIVRFLGEYIRLKKLGNRYVGLCPFHNEKTPSFSVNPTHQYYKCFGCGVGGDIFNFVMGLEGVTFFEALKIVAERNGIPMPKRAEYSDPETKLRGALHRMHEIAASLFQANLNGPAGAVARQYLAGRGVTQVHATEFGLGLSADSWEQLTRRLEQEGFTAEQLEHSGLVSRRQEGSGFYDRFRARLMFPIHDEAGKVIGFGGRALKAGDEPKYLNSPETPLYRKSYVLYNLHRAKAAIRKLDRVVLVEGYMDVIGVYAAGVHEVVASCGTALTNTQVRGLRRHSGQIVVNFDPDAAGANAAEKSLQMLLDESMRVRVLSLEGDLDPDEFIKQSGADRYRVLLDKAPLYYFWMADRARQRFDMQTADGRMGAWKAILPSVERIPDRIERASVAKDMAEYLRVDEKLVLERFRRDEPRKAEPRRNGDDHYKEKTLLRALMESAEARRELIPTLQEIGMVQNFTYKRLFEALFMAAATNENIQLADLQARLNEADADLLARIVLADENKEGTALDVALQIVRMETKHQEMRKAELKDRIKVAERAGDLAGALQLTQELNALSALPPRSKGSR
ncbi:MAG TPA: DNA primase [Bryobacteraceae bacterium]|nr:DNA primase [Bryobacteraceae bacterium]